MDSKNLTYKDAGVDIDAGDALVNKLKKINPAIGGFGGILPIPGKYHKPRMVLATDGVGTKLLVAEELGVYNTIGIDLVAMVVNDIITCGAKPVAFLDYYATDQLRRDQAMEILQGISEGCELAGCDLVGGETAELPGVYPKGGFDLAGFGVGLVEKSEIIDGSKVRSGDVVIGLPSSGVHSNGFSLARKVLLRKGMLKRKRAEILERLLVPTCIYVKPLMKLLRKVPVKAVAHITGGGLPGNLNRVLPGNVDAVLDPTTWELPEIFQKIQETGPVELPEMYRVFNMGIGMCIVVSRKDLSDSLRILRRAMVHAVEIGEIAKGNQRVLIDGVSGLGSGC